MQVKRHAAPDGIILEERPERAVQMNAHRYKVAAILLLASSIAPAPPRRLFKAFTSSTRYKRSKMHSPKGCRRVIHACLNFGWSRIKSGISSVS